MSGKKRGASKARRSKELVHAASLLRASQPDLASGLSQQVRRLKDTSEWPAGVTPAELPFLYGDRRAASRDELVEAAKTLTKSHPTTAYRLLRQAIALTTSHKLRSHLCGLAAGVKRRIDEAHAIERKAANRAREARKRAAAADQPPKGTPDPLASVAAPVETMCAPHLPRDPRETGGVSSAASSMNP